MTSLPATPNNLEQEELFIGLNILKRQLSANFNNNRPLRNFKI